MGKERKEPNKTKQKKKTKDHWSGLTLKARKSK
ncbi:hypothetical protein QG37_04778 [Candidozyma auris]|uniref:Uncharacterized protein n=1 Tax=Candidozyma auris TaxID=498019 RepID=A0A0L0NWJ8_CANAR|nr:hypothetical protein QG37_04778 [[Candida] auris]